MRSGRVFKGLTKKVVLRFLLYAGQILHEWQNSTTSLWIFPVPSLRNLYFKRIIFRNCLNWLSSVFKSLMRSDSRILWSPVVKGLVSAETTGVFDDMAFLTCPSTTLMLTIFSFSVNVVIRGLSLSKTWNWYPEKIISKTSHDHTTARNFSWIAIFK